MDRRPPSRGRARLICATALFTALACAALAAAAMLVPAPAGAVPVIATVCVCSPLLAAWDLPDAVAVLRRSRARVGDKELARLRRGLERLPETEHPLGL